jgi:hypothetical protein
MSEPMTEAGRALVDEFKGYGEPIDLTKDVLAIEAEAGVRATPELEGYWEKAYWRVVPVLQAALVSKTAAITEWLAAEDERAAQWTAAGECGHEDPLCPEMQAIRDTGDATYDRQRAAIVALRDALATPKADHD